MALASSRRDCSKGASRLIGLLLLMCCGLAVPPPHLTSEAICSQACCNDASARLSSASSSLLGRQTARTWERQAAHLQVPLIHEILRGGAMRTMQMAAPAVKSSGIKPPRARHETSLSSDNKISSDNVNMRSGNELLVGRDVEPQLGLRVKMSEASRKTRPFVQVTAFRNDRQHSSCADPGPPCYAPALALSKYGLPLPIILLKGVFFPLWEPKVASFLHGNMSEVVPVGW
jgi:hypothetical protein